jgi:sarcosine oxidase, subunit gamma
MRDLAQKWSPVPDWPTATIAAPGLAVRSLAGFSQYLVSGDLAAWSSASGIAAQAAGALSTAAGARYVLRIARDRILAVSETPLAVEPGWHNEGFAVSACDAGLHMFEVEGERLAELWARATTLDAKGSTPSAAVLFAGVTAFCCRHGHEGRLRIHVDRGLAPYLWKWLERTSAL